MHRLKKSLLAWNTSNFEPIFKEEIEKMDLASLPLQAGLSQSSYVNDSPINVIILSKTQTDNDIVVKAGVYYTGVIAGSCCADDPTPVNEQNEYCEIQFNINKETADTEIVLLHN